MDLTLALDPDSPIPLYRQLYEGLRREILAGTLAPGQRVPSSRALAKQFSLSRNTVAQSYAQLLSEGYFQTIVGSGTYVCRQIPEAVLEKFPTSKTDTLSSCPWKLSTYGNSLVNFNPFSPPDPSALINFRYGRPAINEFPLGIWRQLLSRYCRLEHDVFDYNPDLLGYRPLREAISGYLSRCRSVTCDPDQVLIVSGSQEAIDLAARVLIDRGDKVAIENPGYLGSRQAFAAQGASLYPVPVDESGVVVDSLAAADEAIKLIYVTPSHQFPTGCVLSLARRLELLAWAHNTRALIIEDDYDSEYRYGERPIPALQELDKNGAVIYVGTFSKVLFPALRVGYLVAPANLVRLFSHAKWLANRQSPLLDQYVLTDFINEGHLERHIRRMRHLYGQLRQTLVNALLQYFHSEVQILGENAGMHLMVQFNTAYSDQEIIRQAEKVGVGLTAAAPYYLDNDVQGKFILGYAELSNSQIKEGIYRLSKVLLGEKKTA